MSVDAPRGLAVDGHGNLFVSSRDVVRVVASHEVAAGGATALTVATGDSSVHTVYGAAPRDDYPETVTRCLAGIQ